MDVQQPRPPTPLRKGRRHRWNRQTAHISALESQTLQKLQSNRVDVLREFWRQFFRADYSFGLGSE